ncbi:Ig-like domain-containing protein [candidate division KSB1 bacterium]|nr:Ig-like domain-containing protein [candidate division KSB1 bacterium]
MLRHFNAGVDRFSSDKPVGFSVRCVKDGSITALNNIRITPVSDTLRNRETGRFTCTAIFSDQSAQNVTNLAKWSISPGTAGSIDATGRFTAHDTRTGQETITATYKSKIAHAKVSVIVRETGTLTDIDGNIYKTVKIGDQWWMAQNLKVTHYRNGDAIPFVLNYIEWADLTTPAYCYYNNDSRYAASYGPLYNWYAVNDSRNIAPEGWHVPGDEEWQKLVDYLGGNAVAGGKIKERGTAHWASPNIGATNESGFTALPGGYRAERGGTFWGMGTLAYFWSDTAAGYNIVWLRRLRHQETIVWRIYMHKQFGYSIRLIRD